MRTSKPRRWHRWKSAKPSAMAYWLRQTSWRRVRRQKAAIVVRLLLAEGETLPLRDLPDELQADLTQILGSMRPIDRATLDEVVEEFADELEGLGLTFPKGIAGALTALDGQISPHTAARLRKEAGVKQAGDPWDRIRQLDVKDLLPLIEQESTEVGAIVLSKLDVGRAAEVWKRAQDISW